MGRVALAIGSQPPQKRLSDRRSGMCEAAGLKVAPDQETEAGTLLAIARDAWAFGE